MHSTIKIIFCIIYLIPKMAFAETLAKQGAGLAGVESPMNISYVAQILVSFLVVIGFIFFMAWLMRRSGRFGYGSGQVIKIISSMSLGMREKILVIEVGGANIVVGVAPGQIRTLHVLDSNAELANKNDVKSHIENRGFKQLIDKFSKQ
jgi:flagellar protein FliO/FliZ